eukprot:6147431-Prymnesium_polylepis.1
MSDSIKSRQCLIRVGTTFAPLPRIATTRRSRIRLVAGNRPVREGGEPQRVYLVSPCQNEKNAISGGQAGVLAPHE